MHRIAVIVLTLVLACLIGTHAGLAYPTGITGRTLKSTPNGCGSCHGSSASSGVTVTITGPETVYVGQSATFTVNVSGGSGNDGGVDIAAFRGTLQVLTSTLKLSSGELTHSAKLTIPATLQFTYTAPASPGGDTLYATGKGALSFNSWNWAPNKPLVIASLTGVEDLANLPSDYGLVNNYPNPFNPSTTIEFVLPQAGDVTLDILDTKGSLVGRLVNGFTQAGSHRIPWTAGSLPSGVYFYTLRTAAFRQTKKMIYVK